LSAPPARSGLPGACPDLAREDRVEHGGGIGVSVGELGWDADGLRQLTERASPVRRRRWKPAGYCVGVAASEGGLDRVPSRVALSGESSAISARSTRSFARVLSRDPSYVRV